MNSEKAAFKMSDWYKDENKFIVSKCLILRHEHIDIHDVMSLWLYSMYLPKPKISKNHEITYHFTSMSSSPQISLSIIESSEFISQIVFSSIILFYDPEKPESCNWLAAILQNSNLLKSKRKCLIVALTKNYEVFGKELAALYRIKFSIVDPKSKISINEQCFNFCKNCAISENNWKRKRFCIFLRASLKSYKIYFTLQKEFADEFLGLYVVPNLAQSYIVHKNLLDAEEKLEHYKKYQESHHSRKEIRTGIFKTEDAIEYYESLIKKCQKDYKDNLKEKRIGNSGFAYATFRTTESAARAKRHLMEMKKMLNWVVRTAPAPEEIKWENMEEDYEVLKWQRWLLMIFFIILFFIFVTPAGFLYLVKEGLSSFNGEQFVHGLFKDNFPTLVLLFFQAVIVNYSVWYIVQKEQRVHLSVETTSRLVKYLLFMGFYIFLLQALGSQTLIQLTLEGFWGSWGMRLPIAITQTGVFFTIFIINQAFLANGFDLLQPIIIIVTKFRLSFAETEKEKLLAQEALSFDYAYEFALSLNSLLIVCATQ
ncbi:unnamed protein product [Blepharisma stoltei]|uniref:CSC1/OSCA1-like cytosolic domain-containing protein n=1 Tax=Blepharisma stoltei TaxID=1481888 RepID=A0AAU9KD24_9CILI|nr:unnamed protein product [Blepharisma stoltei]